MPTSCMSLSRWPPSHRPVLTRARSSSRPTAAGNGGGSRFLSRRERPYGLSQSIRRHHPSPMPRTPPAIQVYVTAAYSRALTAARHGLLAQNGLSDTIVINALAIDPSAPTRIYAATQQGVFRSTDAAASWTAINSGLTSLNVWSISIDQTGSILRAATADGLFESIKSAGGHSPRRVEHRILLTRHSTTTSSRRIPMRSGSSTTKAPPCSALTGLSSMPMRGRGRIPRRSAGSSARRSRQRAPISTRHSPAECAIRQADPAWTQESADAFDIAVPTADGSCAEGLTPVYRLYNNGQGGAPNHRYTTDLTVRAQMLTQGWMPEGVGPNTVQMCSPL